MTGNNFVSNKVGWEDRHLGSGLRGSICAYYTSTGKSYPSVKRFVVNDETGLVVAANFRHEDWFLRPWTKWWFTILAHLSQTIKWAIVIERRPSVRKLLYFKLLQNRFCNVIQWPFNKYCDLGEAVWYCTIVVQYLFISGVDSKNMCIKHIVVPIIEYTGLRNAQNPWSWIAQARTSWSVRRAYWVRFLSIANEKLLVDQCDLEYYGV